MKQLNGTKSSYSQPLQHDVAKGIEPPKIKPEQIFDGVKQKKSRAPARAPARSKSSQKTRKY
jgi:hypothetical protein